MFLMTEATDDAAKALVQSKKLAIAQATRLISWLNLSDADKKTFTALLAEISFSLETRMVSAMW